MNTVYTSTQSLSDATKGFDKLNELKIDVYRGRTVLEITYRNGVPIDSAIVFKK